MKKNTKGNSSIFEKIDLDLDLDQISGASIDKDITPTSRQGTAKKAVKMLVALDQGYINPTNKARLNLLIAFAKRNKVVYGKSFDVIRIKDSAIINLEALQDVENNLDKITVYEVKSTNKKEVKLQFERYFFSLSTAELLVAQSLKTYFKFVFVNTNTGEILELTLKQLFEKAKGIYPCWSIQF
jgi:hypothetical protein